MLLAARQSAPDGQLAESLAKVPLPLGLQTGSCLRKTDSHAGGPQRKSKREMLEAAQMGSDSPGPTFFLNHSLLVCVRLSLLPLDTQVHTHICKFVDNFLKQTHSRFVSLIKGALVQM